MMDDRLKKSEKLFNSHPENNLSVSSHGEMRRESVSSDCQVVVIPLATLVFLYLHSLQSDLHSLLHSEDPFGNFCFFSHSRPFTLCVNRLPRLADHFHSTSYLYLSVPILSSPQNCVTLL